LPPSFKQDPSKETKTKSTRHEVNDPKVVKAMTAAYFAKVTMVDDNVGRLLGQLREMGLAENTLIVFTADHGNMLGDLNRWFKGAMYEGSTRIPLLMKAPAASPFAAQFNRGAVINNIVENIDVMPTLCELAGVPLPAQGIQGRSMTKLVAGAEKDRKERAFAERNTQMVRTPQYKLIHEPRGQGSYELYDLTKDPLETNNVVTDPSRAAVVKELTAQLEAWQKNLPPVPVIEGVVPQGTSDDSAPVEKKKRKDRKRKQANTP
ncbi:MAG: sulfatase-like hydrolase/transferase, partial [Verrucomicrobia bacterium]|nr:sulfatase-like hydrolase/transferase [Verrucomicrobiota bacterium]